MTTELVDYVVAHTVRGECRCGKCADRGNAPDPTGHTADLVFFPVALTGDPTVADYRRLTDAHHGAYGAVTPFDGREHGYMELGAWLGDQGLALQYMGLGVLLGVFTLLTPKTVLGIENTEPLALDLAGWRGMVTVQTVPPNTVQ